MGRAEQAELETLKRLWAEQRRYFAEEGTFGADEWYVGEHFATDVAVRRRLINLGMVERHVRGRVLEWGCNHGADSCVYRMRLGPDVELHGADVLDPRAFKPFHDYSGLRYTQLSDDYRLPYPDAYFDAVTSDGVLEHVPRPEDSVREIARVLKPGGAFLVTCLPNRFSYTEAIQRWRGGPRHERLYTMREARGMLEHACLAVERVRWYFMVPTMLVGMPGRARRAYQRAEPLVWAVNSVLERVWPLNRLASNLMLVARKSEAR